jgi:hypothetical protein
MAEISGFCNEPSGKLVDVLSSTIDSGGDLGASVALTVDGELVADFWGGYVDQGRTKPWERDTLVDDVGRSMTFTSMTNQMAPGIIGGPTVEGLLTALSAAV